MKNQTELSKRLILRHNFVLSCFCWETLSIWGCLCSDGVHAPHIHAQWEAGGKMWSKTFFFPQKINVLGPKANMLSVFFMRTHSLAPLQIYLLEDTFNFHLRNNMKKTHSFWIVAVGVLVTYKCIIQGITPKSY